MNQWEWAGPKLYTSNGWGLQLRCFPGLGHGFPRSCAGSLQENSFKLHEIVKKKVDILSAALGGKNPHEKSVVVE